MSKQFTKVVGTINKDVSSEQILSLLKDDINILLGCKNDNTKRVVIEISVKEIKDVI